MSALAQYVAAGLGLLLLGAIAGAVDRIAHALGRIALAQETGAKAIAAAGDPERCPDYPPRP